jgi:hypothetical protein
MLPLLLLLLAIAVVTFIFARNECTAQSPKGARLADVFVLQGCP